MEFQLANTADLFALNEMRYLDVARNVAEQTLLTLRPEQVDPEVWFDQVRDFVSLVFSRMAGANSMEIFYGGRNEEDAKAGNVVPITYQDVLEWVKAGPENGGKDKTILEQERGRQDDRIDEHIAYNVFEAIEQYRLGYIGQKDYGRIADRLQKWVEDRVLAGELGDMLVIVLDAWASVVGAVLEDDFSAHVDEVIGSW
jgi:hypothetical protein